jgi:hypothetical protein
MPPATVIALSGGLGTLTACGLALRWRRLPAIQQPLLHRVPARPDGHWTQERQRWKAGLLTRTVAERQPHAAPAALERVAARPRSARRVNVS